MLSPSLLAMLALAATSAATVLPPRQTPPSTTCTNPVVRKEWRELTDAEKAEYLRAAVCLRDLPKKEYQYVDAVTTRLDDLVYTHYSLNEDIHFVANFLPWHRWFVQLHEDLLRDECGYKGVQPYWDWTIEADSRTMPNSTIWDAETGFGGDGVLTTNTTPGFGRCVVDGPFANTNLTLAMGWPNMNDPGHRKHCFTREFNNASGKDDWGNTIVGDMQAGAYNSDVVRAVLKFDDYFHMHEMLEGLPHAQIHSIIFGDMGPATSPNEPLFFLHHAQVDRIWAKWQARNETRLADYTGFNDRDMVARASVDDQMPVMRLDGANGEGVQPVVRDYMDIQAGKLCYTYTGM